MAEDLGSWPPAQATTLVKVLRKAGVSPSTARDGATVRVTVPEEHADAANAAIAANMDTIARAAREANDRRREVAARKRTKADRPKPLVMERFARLGPLVGLLLVGVLVIAVVPPGARTIVSVVAVVGVLWVAGSSGEGPPRGGGGRGRAA